MKTKPPERQRLHKPDLGPTGGLAACSHEFLKSYPFTRLTYSFNAPSALCQDITRCWFSILDGKAERLAARGSCVCSFEHIFQRGGVSSHLRYAVLLAQGSSSRISSRNRCGIFSRTAISEISTGPLPYSWLRTSSALRAHLDFCESMIWVDKTERLAVFMPLFTRSDD